MELKVSTISVQQQAANKLREAIIAGLFLPGERLVETQLCARLGVSRPSVREALRSLETERLVEIVPNRGPIVTTITWEQAKDIYDVRVVLESEAVALVAGKGAEACVVRMREALAEFIKADRAGDSSRRVSAADHFYEGILLECGNFIIRDVLLSLMARIAFLRAKSMSIGSRSKASAREMKAILDAVEAQDPEAARKAAVDHINNACKAAQAAYNL